MKFYQYINELNEEQPKMTTDDLGSKYWKLSNGQLHRLDGPAIEHSNGVKIWYRNGVLHRDDEPAITYPNPQRYEYYKNGKIHRDDGPAQSEGDGISSTKTWYKDGLIHRDDGPAMEYQSAHWIGNQNYDFKATPTITKTWYKNGQIHRDDGPAIEHTDADGWIKSWCKNGVLHRDDGPAREDSNGKKEWIKNEKKHRIDGPAIEYPNGEKSWYYNDKKVNLSIDIPETLQMAMIKDNPENIRLIKNPTDNVMKYMKENHPWILSGQDIKRSSDKIQKQDNMINKVKTGMNLGAKLS